MKRIRPFIGTDLVKVMTGIRRCGKSVMLDLIKEELKELGISAAQFITFNFEDLRNEGLPGKAFRPELNISEIQPNQMHQEKYLCINP